MYRILNLFKKTRYFAKKIVDKIKVNVYEERRNPIKSFVRFSLEAYGGSNGTENM